MGFFHSYSDNNILLIPYLLLEFILFHLILNFLKLIRNYLLQYYLMFIYQNESTPKINNEHVPNLFIEIHILHNNPIDHIHFLNI